MKTEQEQIEEMAYSICGARDVGIIKSCANCKYKNTCEKIIYAREFSHKGYRKATEVIDEFLERLKELLNKHEHRSQTDGVSFYQMDAESFCDEINKIAAEMRQEVEK